MTLTDQIEGIVEVCCHRVTWRYWTDEPLEFDEELRSRLADSAEDRAKECIIQGCGSGELNHNYYPPDGREVYFRGWFEIERG